MVELNQYYTVNSISHALIEQIPVGFNVTHCLELSAGEGALLDAVSKRWSGVQFVTVDIDPLNYNKLKTKFIEHDHYCCDALCLAGKFKYSENFFSLAVCNPPFGLLSLSSTNIDPVDMEFEFVVSRGGRVRYEILFILQNLKFLMQGGILSIIIPELIVRSSQFKRFWDKLLEKNTIHSVIECQHKSFRKTEAKTNVVTIIKGLPHNDKKIDFLHLLNCDEPSSYKHGHDIKKSVDEIFSIKEFKGNIPGVSVFRGNLAGKYCKDKEGFIHTTTQIHDFGELSFDHKEFDSSCTNTVMQGDIIVHRVGRSVGKTAIIAKGFAMISDCLIAIRFTNECDKEHFMECWKRERTSWLENNIRGTCAKHVTIESIKKYINEKILN